MWIRALASVGMPLMAGVLGCASRNLKVPETAAGQPTTSPAQQPPPAASTRDAWSPVGGTYY